MSIQRYHFTTDGKTIKPCCENMESLQAYDAIRLCSKKSIYCISITGHHADDSDWPCTLYGTYCPFCGTKFKYVNKTDGGQ